MHSFETLGCVVEEAVPEFDIERVWQAFIRLRSWQASAQFRPFIADPAKRDLLNAQALFEVEAGSRLTAEQIRQRLIDPGRTNPDTVMPAYGRTEGLTRVGPAWRGRPILTPAQIEDVVAFLTTLRRQ